MEVIGEQAIREHQNFIQLGQGLQVATRSRRSIAKQNNINRMKAAYTLDRIVINGTRAQNISTYLHGLSLSY